MKFPKCPYCKTRYSCKALAEVKGKKTICRYCGKQLYVSRHLAVIPILSVCTALVIFNTVMFGFNEIKRSDLMMIVMANAVTVFAALLMAPLLLRFDKKRTEI